MLVVFITWFLLLSHGTAVDSQTIPFCVPPDTEVTYNPPQMSNLEVQDIVDGFGGLWDTLSEMFTPSTVLCVGCSKGGGRAIACNMAASGAAKVISLATTVDLVPVTCPDGGDNRIVNVAYDISNIEGVSRLDNLLDGEGISTIDLLVLNAGRDVNGPLRLWKGKDMVNAYRNNVIGHHTIWQQIRNRFNPEGAVVLAVSSLAAETRFLASRNVYGMTKQSLAELVLGYAYEEAEVQPNTKYAVVYQGDVASSFGLEQMLPDKIPKACQAELEGFGYASWASLNFGSGAGPQGMAVTDLADFYHNVYTLVRIWDNYISPYLPDPNTNAPVPMTFSIEPPVTFTPLATLQFNHRLVPASGVLQCYENVWDYLSVSGNFDPATLWYLDPRKEPPNCSA